MEQLETNRIRIQDFLNPIQGLNTYFVEYKDNILHLNISNLQRLPVEILGILFDDNSKNSFKLPFNHFSNEYLADITCLKGPSLLL